MSLQQHEAPSPRDYGRTHRFAACVRFLHLAYKIRAKRLFPGINMTGNRLSRAVDRLHSVGSFVSGRQFWRAQHDRQVRPRTLLPCRSLTDRRTVQLNLLVATAQSLVRVRDTQATRVSKNSTGEAKRPATIAQSKIMVWGRRATNGPRAATNTDDRRRMLKLATLPTEKERKKPPSSQPTHTRGRGGSPDMCRRNPEKIPRPPVKMDTHMRTTTNRSKTSPRNGRMREKMFAPSLPGLRQGGGGMVPRTRLPETGVREGEMRSAVE